MPTYESGYGDADRNLADRLSDASTQADADAEARRDGLNDAADAADWLKSRTGF